MLGPRPYRLRRRRRRGAARRRRDRLLSAAPLHRATDVSRAETSPIVVGTTAAAARIRRPAVRAFSRQPREIPLAWRPSHADVASGYVVERSPSQDGPYEVVARIPGRFATSYVDTRARQPARALLPRVDARRPSGASGPPSDPVRAVTKPEPLPPLGLRLGRVVARPQRDRLGAQRRERHRRRIGCVRLRRAASPTLSWPPCPPTPRSAEDTRSAAGESARYAVVAIDRDGLESRPSSRSGSRARTTSSRPRADAQGVSLRWSPRPDEFPQARIARSSWLGERELGRTEDGELRGPGRRSPAARYRYVVVLIRPDGSEAPPSRPARGARPGRRRVSLIFGPRFLESRPRIFPGSSAGRASGC